MIINKSFGKLFCHGGGGGGGREGGRGGRGLRNNDFCLHGLIIKFRNVFLQNLTNYYYF